MKFTGIIPARFASTRFPGKPLADIAGRSMIRRVYEQASKCSSLQQVIVATDDLRIYDHVSAFGGVAMMSSDAHQSGTDRCAEIASAYPDTDVFINIQGDEPFIDPNQIDLLCACFERPEVVLATLVKKINSVSELLSQNTPKVVLSKSMNALYFSRTAIPFIREQDENQWLNYHTYYKHVGIYGYTNDTLRQISNLPVSALESAEMLEQLRWLENGLPIRVAITDVESIAIDTPEDLQRILLAIS